MVTINDFAYTIGTNRVTSIVNSPNTALNRSYTYDDNGNLLTDDFRHLESTVYGRSSYAFSIAKPSGEDIEYLYDHNDQRVFKKDVTSAQTTLEYYIKDAMGRDLAIVKKLSSDTMGSLTEYYVYGPDRIAKINAGSSSSDTTITGTEVTFFLSDHLGNNRVAFTLDSSNTVVIVNAMDYFPYGKILREFDNGDGNRFLTTQHERDKETGLDYRGARYYDSDVARFLSLDPLAAKYPAWSAYNYVMGNPIILMDPAGKEPTPTRWTENHVLLNNAFGDGSGFNSLIKQRLISNYSYDKLEHNYEKDGQKIVNENPALNYLAGQNTCAIKMSYSFNRSGYMIPSSQNTPRNVRVQNTKNGNYILDADSFINYLMTIEKPTYSFENINTVEKLNEAISQIHLSDDARGIIGLRAGDKNTYQASGHVDLLYEDWCWDLSFYSYDGDDVKTYVENHLMINFSIYVWVLDKD